MEILSLNGDWTLYQQGKEESIKATVPGCVHTDLLSAEEIKDPFYRDNEKNILWIGETDWSYKREFIITSEMLKNERILLRCKGLDTLATIIINDQQIAETNNMFRTYEFDVKNFLIEGINKIEISFAAPMPYVREKEEKFKLPAWGVDDHKLTGGGWIRKEPCNFGWDWGIKVPTCGIWRDIELVLYSNVRMNDVLVLQDHIQKGNGKKAVKLNFKINLELTNIELIKQEEVFIRARVVYMEDIITETELNVGPEIVKGNNINERIISINNLEITNPHLWWPNGMGEQPLYNIEIEIYYKDQLLDKIIKRIGLRTLELVRESDEWGQSFNFAVNGRSFFAKGANWIPADAFVTRLSKEDYQRLLEDAATANMNMLRAWGGGIYEEDSFYEICDELGICVWQDFIFACSTYPGFDDDFLNNIRKEAEDNVRRIRHHACLALWCGNNELEQGLVGEEWTDSTMSWQDYTRIFDVLLPEVINEFDPQRDYWPSSPHSPLGNREDWRNPKWGDAHLWNVWHGKKPFEWYRTCKHRFNSEFGFQSFPEPGTVYSYTLPEDRSINTYIMEYHQRSGIGNTTIMEYMLDWFRLPTSFEDILWISQILQGMAIKYAVEHWRRGMPRQMGTLYWQLNDNWPVASWSSIDYYGNKKALYYMTKKFFSPLLLSGLENKETGTVEIYLSSDLYQEQLKGEIGIISWQLTDVEGNLITESSFFTEIPIAGSKYVRRLELKNYIKSYGGCNLILWLKLTIADIVVSDNLILFAPPKHLQLQKPEISYVLKEKEKGFLLSVSAKKPALWVWIEMIGLRQDIIVRYSDNFFHILPGETYEIDIKVDSKITIEELESAIKVCSLIDTYLIK